MRDRDTGADRATGGCVVRAYRRLEVEARVRAEPSGAATGVKGSRCRLRFAPHAALLPCGWLRLAPHMARLPVGCVLETCDA